MNEHMVELAEQWPGYLGRESTLLPDGSDLVLIYWTDDESIRSWKQNAEHLEAQRLGRERWHARYRVEIARVERAYEFTAPGVSGD